MTTVFFTELDPSSKSDHYTYYSDNILYSRKKAHAKLAEQYSNGRTKIVKFTNGSFLNYGSAEWTVSIGI